MSTLDSPVWSALTGAHRGGHRDLARGADVGSGRARSYPADVCPFSAVADVRDPAAWADLAHLLAGDRLAVVPTFDPAHGDPVPTGWEVAWSIPGVQLVAGPTTPPPPAEDADLPVLALGEDDVDDMLALVELTRPGPFERRTRLLGPYLGVRDPDGTLVALAGERLHPGGAAELSAVCTHPRARGRGLATRLVLTLVRDVRERGDVPFLHAAATNAEAVRLYQRLGFSPRRSVAFTGLRPP
ncbi:GNAT family N-acetyltransferase [Kineococcus gynurae]|uniref:GNAT family N-acetyltransferase n=1 Tax=Kineococcus gynurae TaxID=452979 RepID=A0ABV5LTB5_9ACTN